jgi:hypothetical protein
MTTRQVSRPEIGQRQESHRMVNSELHDRVDVFAGANSMVEAVNGFVDHG